MDTEVYCITCHSLMLGISETGFICVNCENIYDPTQIGPHNRELERTWNLYDQESW